MNSTQSRAPAPTPSARLRAAAGSPRLRPKITRAHAEQLQAERDRLRRELEIDFAERLRIAREFGSPSENDEYLQIKEEEAVLAAGIAHITLLLDSAIVIDERGRQAGIAAIGTTVRVQFTDTGETRDFQLIGGHETLSPNAASAGSPMGQAVMGKSPGAEVTVQLPRGERRAMKILSVAATRGE